MTAQQDSLCVFQTGLLEPTCTCQVSVFITFLQKMGTIGTTLNFCSEFGSLCGVYDRQAGLESFQTVQRTFSKYVNNF